MFEEIQLTGETVRPTVHPQIVVTHSPQPSPADVQEWLAAARLTARDGNATRETIRRLVPEYTGEVLGSPAVAETVPDNVTVMDSVRLAQR